MNEKIEKTDLQEKKSLREIFIENLKYFRKQKGYSQEKLSKEIDMSMNYINSIENKATFPQPEVIERISNILEIRPCQLYDELSCEKNVISTNKAELLKQMSDSFCERLYSKFLTDIREEIKFAFTEI